MAPSLLATLALCGAAGAGALPGLEDRAVLLQTSVRGEEADVQTMSHTSQLKSLLDSQELQNAVAEQNRRAQGFVQDLVTHGSARVDRVKEEAETFAKDADRPSATPKALPHDVEQVKEDMRAVLRQFAPDPAQGLMLLQQSSIGRNASIPQEELDHVTESIASMSKAFQANTALHEQILSRIPMLHGLIEENWLFDPLQGPANTSAGVALQGKELTDRLPKLVGRGVATLKSLRLAGGESDAEERPATIKETIAKIQGDGKVLRETLKTLYDPYLELASRHGRKWSPAAKAGCGYSLKMGFVKKFNLNQVLKYWNNPVELAKRVFMEVRVGVSCARESGMGYGASFGFQLQDASLVGRPEYLPSVDNYFTVLSLTKTSPFIATTSTGFTTSYVTDSDIGAGFKYRFFPQKPFPCLDYADAMLPGLLHTFDFDSAKANTPWGGWRYGAKGMLGVNAVQKDARVQKFVVASKTIYAPSQARGYPDFRFRTVVDPTVR
mmetsp:Transcript_30336/g.68981  ORF Transcript_30336/g.68981 Transcript_30336/m.68981 type:complete len:496 (-) Transcript_30336:61-1548(-)